jgi:hypothetical protein
MTAPSLMLEVQAKIQRVDEMIADLRKTATRHPRPSLFANIRALEKEQRFLQQEFEHFAASMEEDVYRYRVLNVDRPTLAGLSEAWKAFQELFTATYQSLRFGVAPPAAGKKRSKTQPDPLPTGPLFGWGYSYQGSVGVGLTLPRKEGTLVEDPYVEETTNIIFDLASAEDVVEATRRLGPSTVNAMFRWAEVHTRNRFGVGIEWRRDLSQKRELVLPAERVATLKESLARTTIETQITVTGELVAADFEKSQYRLHGDDGEDYSGRYSDAITRDHTAVLPARYSATIKRVSKVVLPPDGKDVPEFHLMKLVKL